MQLMAVQRLVFISWRSAKEQLVRALVDERTGEVGKGKRGKELNI